MSKRAAAILADLDLLEGALRDARRRLNGGLSEEGESQYEMWVRALMLASSGSELVRNAIAWLNNETREPLFYVRCEDCNSDTPLERRRITINVEAARKVLKERERIRFPGLLDCSACNKPSPVSFRTWDRLDMLMLRLIAEGEDWTVAA